MNPLIKLLLLPFSIIYYIFGIFTGKNNYYTIAKNTTEIYNILKESENGDFLEKEAFFLAGVMDAYTYLINGQLTLSDIDLIAENSENINDFLFNFINTLLKIDIGEEAFYRGIQSQENIDLYKRSIQKGIDDSKKHNKKFYPLVQRVLGDDAVINFLSSKASQNKYKEYLEDEIQNELNEVLEINEDKKESLLEDMYRQVYNGEYKKIIDFNNSFSGLFDYLKDTNNMEDIGFYCLLVGACYQETGKIDIADKYYDVFLSNISLDKKVIEGFASDGIDNIGAIKMMILIKRLEDLGISYKLPAEAIKKPKSKINKKKGKGNDITSIF